MKIKLTLLTIAFFTLPFLVQARHILGGTISYTHISGDQYRIDMKIHRDCASTGAPFDSPAIIGLYRGDTAPYELVQDFPASPGMTSLLDPIIDDCVNTPFPLCIEEGIYTFTADLPDIGENYHLVYQRCCRTNTYANIYDASVTGFTITTVITPAALQANNSSPVLANAPFFELCNAQEFSFDLSATDSDSDSLVYEFCTPIIGAGSVGTPSNPGDASACNGVVPNPSCPPPFDSVSFILPNYTYDQPLSASSEVTLDRNTGMLIGTPSTLGHFLAGVCVTEYRDGAILSVSRQELSFWVDFASDIETPQVQALSFYPNPAEDKVFIDLPEQSNSFDLRIRDVNGKVIQEVSNINGISYELNTEVLSGLYFLELQTEDLVYFGKLIVL